MTWSIIAKDSATGQIGIAVATKFFAAGARVPHVAAGVGAIATQALVNPYYSIDGVRLLREGKNPHDIIAALIAVDDGRVSRERWVHFRKFLPTRERPAGITDRATIDAGIEQALASEQ